MRSRAMRKGQTPRTGEKMAFQVNAQVAEQFNPIGSFAARVMRAPPTFHAYNINPIADTIPRSRSQTPSVDSVCSTRTSSPAPLTFVSENPKDLTSSRPSKRRKIEETTPKPSKHRFTNKKTVFSTNRPLKKSDDVYDDIWAIILADSHPRFLLQAKTVSRSFYNILSSDLIWKKSRQNHLQENTPACPEGATEQQFTDLLVARGCQASSCDKENTTSVAWAFLARFCPGCIRSKTTSLEEISEDRRYVLSNGRNLCDALPLIHLSNSQRIELRDVRPDGNGALEYVDHGRGTPYRFLRSAYAELEAEYMELCTAGASDDEINSWWQPKYDLTMKLMKERQSIATWSRVYQTTHDNTGQSVGAQRRVFFVDKAKSLKPPMGEQTLEFFAAYKKALQSQNPPTDRAWETLKKKIMPYRADAETLQRAVNVSALPSEMDEKLEAHRDGFRKPVPILAPEQQYVVDFSRTILQSMLDANVADSDIVLLLLKTVYERYQALPNSNKPQGLNFNGKIGAYELSMDDARMIVEVVIKKYIPALSQRGMKVLTRFKCPACVSEKERGKVFNFSQTLDHLLNVHGRAVGDGPEYWRYALYMRASPRYNHQHHYQFPWYTVPWPRCLPVLAEHHEPETFASWHPDLDLPYVREVVNETSAFEGLKAKVVPSCNSFIGFFLHAARVVSGVRLESPALTRLAMQYAMWACQELDIGLPSLQEFIQAIPEIQVVNSAMEFRFRCGACMRYDNVRQSARHVKHRIPIADLHSHWVKCHRLNAPPSSPTRRRRSINKPEEDLQHWTQDFMHLPSDTEMYMQMVASDADLAKEKTDIQAGFKNAKRKQKTKSTVILATKSSREVFEELFVAAD